MALRLLLLRLCPRHRSNWPHSMQRPIPGAAVPVAGRSRAPGARLHCARPPSTNCFPPGEVPDRRMPGPTLARIARRARVSGIGACDLDWAAVQAGPGGVGTETVLPAVAIERTDRRARPCPPRSLLRLCVRCTSARAGDDQRRGTRTTGGASGGVLTYPAVRNARRDGSRGSGRLPSRTAWAPRAWCWFARTASRCARTRPWCRRRPRRAPGPSAGWARSRTRR